MVAYWERKEFPQSIISVYFLFIYAFLSDSQTGAMHCSEETIEDRVFIQLVKFKQWWERDAPVQNKTTIYPTLLLFFFLPYINHSRLSIKDNCCHLIMRYLGEYPWRNGILALNSGGSTPSTTVHGMFVIFCQYLYLGQVLIVHSIPPSFPVWTQHNSQSMPFEKQLLNSFCQANKFYLVLFGT